MNTVFNQLRFETEGSLNANFEWRTLTEEQRASVSEKAEALLKEDRTSITLQLVGASFIVALLGFLPFLPLFPFIQILGGAIVVVGFFATTGLLEEAEVLVVGWRRNFYRREEARNVARQIGAAS
jgi:hypothetical protein